MLVLLSPPPTLLVLVPEVPLPIVPGVLLMTVPVLPRFRLATLPISPTIRTPAVLVLVRTMLNLAPLLLVVVVVLVVVGVVVVIVEMLNLL